MSILLDMCQKEFYPSDGELKSIKDLEWNKKISDAKDETERRFLEKDYQEYLRKTRDRFLNIIKFISELYKHALISDKILNDCLNKLSKDKTTLSYEALCNLIRFSGKDYTERKVEEGNIIDEIFFRLLGNDLLPPQIRSMINDLVELKNNNWVPPKDKEVLERFECKTSDKIVAPENEEPKPRSINKILTVINPPEDIKIVNHIPSLQTQYISTEQFKLTPKSGCKSNKARKPRKKKPNSTPDGSLIVSDVNASITALPTSMDANTTPQSNILHSTPLKLPSNSLPIAESMLNTAVGNENSHSKFHTGNVFSVSAPRTQAPLYISNCIPLTETLEEKIKRLKDMFAIIEKDITDSRCQASQRDRSEVMFLKKLVSKMTIEHGIDIVDIVIARVHIMALAIHFNWATALAHDTSFITCDRPGTNSKVVVDWPFCDTRY
ncbi:unnamed protein product [Gordionus sp. m RMFG-2023]